MMGIVFLVLFIIIMTADRYKEKALHGYGSSSCDILSCECNELDDDDLKTYHRIFNKIKTACFLIDSRMIIHFGIKFYVMGYSNE